MKSTRNGLSRREMLAGGAALAAVPFWGVTAQAAQTPPTELPEGAVIILAQLTAKDGKEAEMRAALAEMLDPTHKEDGCICYLLHQAKDDKRKFMFYEQWASQAALDAHGKSDHMKVLQKKLAGLVDKGAGTLFDMVQ